MKELLKNTESGRNLVAITLGGLILSAIGSAYVIEKTISGADFGPDYDKIINTDYNR